MHRFIRTLQLHVRRAIHVYGLFITTIFVQRDFRKNVRGISKRRNAVVIDNSAPRKIILYKHNKRFFNDSRTGRWFFFFRLMVIIDACAVTRVYRYQHCLFDFIYRNRPDDPRGVGHGTIVQGTAIEKQMVLYVLANFVRTFFSLNGCT